MSRLTEVRKKMGAKTYYRTRVTEMMTGHHNYTSTKAPDPCRSLAAAILYQALADDAYIWYTDRIHRHMDQAAYDIYSGLLGIPYTYEELLDIFVQNNGVEAPGLEQLLRGW